MLKSKVVMTNLMFVLLRPRRNDREQFQRKEGHPLIFTQFWSRIHLNKLDCLTRLLSVLWVIPLRLTGWDSHCLNHSQVARVTMAQVLLFSRPGWLIQFGSLALGKLMNKRGTWASKASSAPSSQYFVNESAEKAS